MKKILCLLLALLTTLSCVSCVAKEEVPAPEPEPEVVEKPAVLNPLTGEELKHPDAVNNRPVAVMINNIEQAMPTHGLSDADILYEYNVEGGITRIMAVFQDVSEVGTIGSVRSARRCFVETALGLDAIYAHAGGSKEALGMIRDLGMDDISENNTSYWRDSERAKTMSYEHTLMTNGEKITAFINDHDFRTQHNSDYSYPITYVEDATPTNGTDAQNVSVRFSGYKTGTFTYDADSHKYLVGQYGTSFVDGNSGNQLGVTNVLVLRTSVSCSGDYKGHMNIDLQGSGTGTFICGGKAVDIQWTKSQMSDPFSYTLTDGTPLELNVGNSYVCIIANDAALTIE